VLAVTGRPTFLSGLITEKLNFLIIIIVIACPVVKSLNAQKEMVLGAALNHCALENMNIWVNALRSIQEFFQSSAKYWRSLEKFGEVWRFWKVQRKVVRSLLPCSMAATQSLEGLLQHKYRILCKINNILIFQLPHKPKLCN
jgi:hypothetical protein